MPMIPWNATVQDDNGNAVPSPVVTVRKHSDNSLATIYDIDGVAASNPLTGTSAGFVQFQVQPGKYKIEGAKDGATAQTWQLDVTNGAYFDARTDFVSAVSAMASVDGMVVIVEGVIYQYDGGSDIVDLPGWKTVPVKPPSMVVADLPSASTSGAGSIAYVTDASVPLAGEGVAGGGAIGALVVSDGTDWIVNTSDYDAIVSAATTAATGAVELVTKSTGTFTPTIAFATPGTSNITYGASQDGWYQRIDNVVEMGFNVSATFSIGSAAGRLRLDFSDSGFTASSVSGTLSMFEMVEHGDFLDVSKYASGLRWVVAPGTQYAELSFSTPLLIEQVTTYNHSTYFKVGEVVTGGTSGETATIIDIVNTGNVAGTSAGDQYLQIVNRTGSFTSGETLTGDHGGSGTVGGSVTTIDTGGTEYVGPGQVKEVTVAIKAFGRFVI